MKCPKCGGEMEHTGELSIKSHFEIIEENSEKVVVSFTKDDDAVMKNYGFTCKNCGCFEKDSRIIEYK